MTTSPAIVETSTLRPPGPGATRAPILVASDGAPASEPALLAARLLAARIGAPVHIVSAITPQALVVPVPEGVALPGESIAELVARRRDQLRDEMRRVLGDQDAWPMQVRIGIPALEIADVAEAMGAQFVVTGLVHRGRFDRMLRGETPLGILHEARVPTLAVPPGAAQELPRCVLVGVDLTDASVDAARSARPLMQDAETVYLVHVQARMDVGPPVAAPSWDDAYREAVKRAFTRVREALDLAPTVHVESKVFSGNVAQELLDFADYAKVDLLVTGHRHRALVERLLGGGIAARLFRGASTWILMVPQADRHRAPTAGTRPTGIETSTTASVDRADWPTFLESFTRRNSGRRARLEVHQHEIGAQTTVTNQPFIGMDYDRHGARVDIMLGDFEGAHSHLTHSLRRVQDVELYRMPDGQDGALRVTDRFGHTLLTFTR